MSTRGKKDNMDDCPKLDVKSAENILRNVFNERGILPPENLSRFFRTSEEAIDKKTERGDVECRGIN